ncbi:MAG: hypothetical protein ACFFAE_05645 [Candidatus Hodarchaeota archaeon]
MEVTSEQLNEFIGVWIIEKESGIPICSVDFGESTEIDSVLFGGFLVAIRGMMDDLKIGELNSFQTDQSNLLFTGSEEIFSVLAIKKGVSADSWYPTLLEVQKMVEDHYCEHCKEQDLIDTSIFEELKPDIQEIIFNNIKSFERIQKAEDDQTEGNIEFLSQFFTKGVGKIIYSLMLNEPILIVGDVKDIVQKVSSAIPSIIPNRTLKVDYAYNYIDPRNKDLIVCSSHANFLNKYKNLTLVDVDNRRITSKIKEVPSIDNLLNTLQIIPRKKQKGILEDYINNLLKKTDELATICQNEDISREEIRKFREDLKPDELNLIISIIKRKAPELRDKLFHFARSSF